MDHTDQHCVSVDEVAQPMADVLGSEIEYKWDAPDTKDIEKVNNAVAADLKILAADDPTQFQMLSKMQKIKVLKLSM